MVSWKKFCKDRTLLKELKGQQIEEVTEKNLVFIFEIGLKRKSR